MSAPPAVVIEQRGHVLLVTIDRPRVCNAVDRDTAWLIAAAMDRIDDDPDIFAGILTGAGGIFSAGADLNGASSAGNTRPLPDRGPFGLCKRPPAKPLIAAIEGYALGGGLEMALCCDLIVATRDAKLGLPEARHGLVAAAGGLFRLPQRIPHHLAMEIALTGKPFPATLFHAHGLVNRLAEPGGALDAAFTVADELLLNGPIALAATVQVMRAARDWSDAEAWERQEPMIAASRRSEDREEGLRAFAEKRRPRWRGR